MAYSRSLFYEKVSRELATNLYALPSSALSLEESKKIEGFVFHWIKKKSAEYKLHIQMHTGSLGFGRSVVAEVLDRRLSRGLLPEELALQIMDAIFRENAIRVFALEGGKN